MLDLYFTHIFMLMAYMSLVNLVLNATTYVSQIYMKLHLILKMVHDQQTPFAHRQS